VDDILYSETVGLKIDKSLVSRARRSRGRWPTIDNKPGKRSLIDGNASHRKSKTVNYKRDK